MKRTFIETSLFTASIKPLLKDDPNLLLRLQSLLLQDPEAGDRIPGAGGARKIRVPTKNKGKSGGYRTIYYDLSRRGEIYLLAIYLKKTQENISESEKKVIAKLIKVLNDL